MTVTGLCPEHLLCSTCAENQTEVKKENLRRMRRNQNHLYYGIDTMYLSDELNKNTRTLMDKWDLSSNNSCVDLSRQSNEEMKMTGCA